MAIDSDSLDLVILHHTLDFSAAPHQSLREAARVLKSSGNLLIVGFNPVSSWGLRKLMSRSRLAPWDSSFIAGKRIEDWLNLLDFSLNSLEYCYYGLPFNNLGLMKQYLWLNNILNAKVPLGAYYVVHAQKQVTSRISRGYQWPKKAKVVGLPLANNTRSRASSENAFGKDKPE